MVLWRSRSLIPQFPHHQICNSPHPNTHNKSKGIVITCVYEHIFGCDTLILNTLLQLVPSLTSRLPHHLSPSLSPSLFPPPLLTPNSPPALFARRHPLSIQIKTIPGNLAARRKCPDALSKAPNNLYTEPDNTQKNASTAARNA